MLVGIGLVSYGLLHLVLAWIAIRIVLWNRGDASSEGALSQLRKQPLGEVLLWVMAIGLFTLTLWQAVEATIGRDAAKSRQQITPSTHAPPDEPSSILLWVCWLWRSRPDPHRAQATARRHSAQS